MEMSLFWLCLSVPLAILGLNLLILVIINLIKLFKKSVVFRFPAAQSTTLEFSQPGKFELYLETPFFSSAMGLKYELISLADYCKIPLRWTMSLNRNNGSTATFLIKTFKIKKVGTFAFNFLSFSQQNHHQYNFIVSHPIGFRTILHIFALLVCGHAFIGGTVFSVIIIGKSLS